MKDKGQDQGKCRTTAKRAFKLDVPTEQGSQALAKRQAKTRAVTHGGTLGVELNEILENECVILLRNPDAGIGNRQLQEILIQPLGRYPDFTSFSILQGIANKITKDLRQFGFIGNHRREFGCIIKKKIDVRTFNG
jgi:hypothetical protein